MGCHRISDFAPSLDYRRLLRGSKDSLHEVLNMRYERNCSPEEELPPRAGLIVVRENDPNFGLSDTEIQDRIEFIRCYLLKDFEAILLVPRQDQTDDFFVQDYLVMDGGYSAFNTVDFQNTMRSLNKYGYAMKKIFERVKDLAIMHSCISQPEHRKEVYQNFKNFIARKFGYQLEEFAIQLHLEESSVKRYSLRRKIRQLEQKIRQCQKIWERYAPPDWDC